jgi:XRE family aerobic/anaerobic benzoate catabolism transcriptional regulator
LTQVKYISPALGAPHEAAEILTRLGAKVRALRQAQALTMRELATRAGYSERFLVMLEAGRTNVSVTRLADLASALSTTSADLLGGPAPRAQGRIPLIALLGLRGAGKTAIGERVAARLGTDFVELDSLVAQRAGMSLGQLFEMHGQAYYRRLEREELERLALATRGGVLATGGSIVTDHATYNKLRASATTVWLRAKPEDHWARVVAQGDARPMANRSDAMKELRTLLRTRRPLYEMAEHVVDTSALGLERSVERVVRIAREAARECET